MIRVFDFLISFFAVMFLLPLLILILVVGLFDTGSPLFFQRRVGKQLKPFTLIKFRTMQRDTPHVATHSANANAITSWGAFLRRTKLDELPQLFNVLIGDMSLVGPRPCLYTQSELLLERTRLGVFDVRPGITGLAQVQGVDMSNPEKLARIDSEMIKNTSVRSYFALIVLTAIGKGRGDRVKNI